MVYLDHHASHPLLPPVKQAMVAAMSWVGNPSSVHQAGQQARAAIEDVREQLAAWVGMPDGRVIFTSGATEANNLALNSHDDVVLASSIEHPAVLTCVSPENLLPVTPTGVVDMDALSARLGALPSDARPLVSVMYANNETGILQPISLIAQLVHQHGGLLHVDAVQALGRAQIDMRVQGIDLLSVSGHKIGAPAGIGALIAPQTIPITAQIAGGGQERGLRGGTENLLGIVGLGAAMGWYQDQQDAHVAHLEGLERLLAAELAATPVIWLGANTPRLAGCALLLVAGAQAQSLLMQLDLAGFAVSSGAACSSGTVADSHVLRAMGVDQELRASALRVSFGASTTAQEVRDFVAAYRRSIAQ